MGDDTSRQRILNAAGPIFAELGFEKATVREICKVAQVNIASINYYFGDKKKLYLESVKHARQSRAEQYPFPLWSQEIPPEQKLHGFIRTLLQRLTAMGSAPWQVQLLMREMLHPTEACSSLVKDYFKPIFSSLLMIIDELLEEPVSDDERIKIGFSVIGQCLHYRYGSNVIAMILSSKSRDESFEIDQVAEHITRFSLGAIRSFTKNEQLTHR